MMGAAQSRHRYSLPLSSTLHVKEYAYHFSRNYIFCLAFPTCCLRLTSGAPADHSLRPQPDLLQVLPSVWLWS
jgi:hypothetical protein